MKVYHKFLITTIILAVFLSVTLLGPTYAQDKCGVRPHCPPPCDGTCSCNCCECETSYRTCDRYSTRCECQPVQEPWDADLDVDKSVYEVGERVEIIFLNPKDYDFEFSRIYIQQLKYNKWEKPEVVTVFEYEDPQSIEPGNRWTWTWNQKDCINNQVFSGRFMAVVETDDCESYRALFRVGQVDMPSDPTLCSCYSDICDP